MEMAKDILAKVGVPDCQLERAHRDGRQVEGRDRHILVKLSFFQNKVTALRNQRRDLVTEPYYILDDLTKVDLIEKRNYSKKIAELFQQGTRLRFSGGCCRFRGRPYHFS